jgi:hypothetical protein
LSIDGNGESSSEKSADTPPVVLWSGSELDDIPYGFEPRYIDRTAGMSEAQTRTAALLCGLIIAGFAGVGIFLGEVYPEKQVAELSDCTRVATDTERLSCYDKVANQSTTGPFKGASPFSTYSRSDVDTSDAIKF